MALFLKLTSKHDNSDVYVNVENITKIQRSSNAQETTIYFAQDHSAIVKENPDIIMQRAISGGAGLILADINPVARAFPPRPPKLV